jgi:transposase
MVDEMEQAGHIPYLAHALRAKRRMEGRHKTNQRDAQGLAMLLRNGTLPVVWIPPAEMRDQREMLRWRMSLSRMRTRVKNRIHAVLQRYNVEIEFSDLFGDGGRAELLSRLQELPCYSGQSLVKQLQTVDWLETQIGECEQVLEEMLYPSVERDLLDSLPCVGKVLSAVLALEIGAVQRFGGPDHLVSYAGLVPVARESADWKRKDRCPRDCQVYLKWAYVEAANLISIRRKQWAHRHVVQLYERVKQSTKMHGKATMAVARHLAEASYWMLSKQQIYQEPQAKRTVLSSTHG